MQESNVALTIEYKGPSVDAGALFAETLTPSLLALSDALKALNRLVNPEGVEAEPSILKFELEFVKIIYETSALDRRRKAGNPSESTILARFDGLKFCGVFIVI